MFMDLKQPAAALTEYQAVLKKEPNRFRALYGAAKAAAAAGNSANARSYYQQIVKLCPKGDTPGRAELEEARMKSRAMPGPSAVEILFRGA